MFIEEVIENTKTFKESSKFTKSLVALVIFFVGFFFILQLAVDVVVLVFLFSGNNQKSFISSLQSGDFIVNGANYVAGMSFSNLGTPNSSIEFILQSGDPNINTSLPPFMKVKYVSEGVYKVGMGTNDPQQALDVGGGIFANSIGPKDQDNFTLRGNVINIESSTVSPSNFEINLPEGKTLNINGGLSVNSGQSISNFLSGNFTLTFSYGFATPHTLNFTYVKIDKMATIFYNNYWYYNDYTGTIALDSYPTEIPTFLRPVVEQAFPLFIYFANPLWAKIGQISITDYGGIYMRPDIYSRLQIWTSDYYPAIPSLTYYCLE